VLLSRLPHDQQGTPCEHSALDVASHDACCCVQIQIAKVTADSAVVSEPYSLDTKWDYKAFVKAKAGMDTGGSW